MSIVAMHWAWDVCLDYLGERDNKAGRRLLLVSLADNANEQGTCWPSIATLAKRCESSTKSVRRWLHEFEEHQLLTIEPRRNASGQTSNLYLLKLDRSAAEKKKSPTDTESGGEGDSESTPHGPRVRGPRTPDDQGPRTPEVPRTISEPSMNPSHSQRGGDVFVRAAQQTDDGEPVETQSRQQPMTLDWEPDHAVWQRACFDRGLPTDLDVHQPLIDFREHYAAQPGRRLTHSDWTRRFVRWIHENQKRQAANPHPTGGAPHGNRSQRTPSRRVSAAEARRAAEQARTSGAGTGAGGDTYDGEYSAVGFAGNRRRV